MSTSAQTGKKPNNLTIQWWIATLADFFSQAVDFIKKGSRSQEMINALLKAFRLFKEDKLQCVLSKDECSTDIDFYLKVLRPGTIFQLEKAGNEIRICDANYKTIYWPGHRAWISIPNIDSMDRLWDLIFGINQMTGSGLKLAEHQGNEIQLLKR